MNVPFLDLRASYMELAGPIDSAIRRVLDSGQYILGDEVERFEEDFARYCQARYAVGAANGMDALHLALRALEIGPGDEVVVPSNTFIATWLAVTSCGATPVPVEPNGYTFNLEATEIAKAITPRTKAVIPVHLYGQPCDLDPILALARAHGLKVIEDAAQAHGARYKGKPIGAHGDVVAWSFYPGKNLGALGDGGAATTDDADLAEKMRILRNYGSRKKYVNEVPGYNSRLDPLQAAVLTEKLKVLDQWNDRRRAAAARYSAALQAGAAVAPTVIAQAEPAWHLYVVRSSDRDGLGQKLAARGIQTMVHYPIPPHLQQAYASLGHQAGAFPLAEQLAQEVLSLPIGPSLTPEMVAHVSAVLTELVRSPLR